MEELCGNLTSSDYTFPENLVASDCYNPFSPPGVSCFPVFGSDQQLVFSGSNSASDSDSMVVHEMNTSTSTNTNTNTTTSGSGSKEEVSGVIRAKICSHPLYPNLLQAYIDCQKVGAPPEIANVLDEILRETDRQRSSTTLVSSSVGEDPELDDFMETYCDILLKFKSDLSRPFQEATDFLSNVEAQFNSLCSSSFQVSDEAVGTPEEDAASIEEVELPAGCTQQNEDRELKDKLLRKYSGYISTLKQEFSKKKKNGKLPKEARQILLAWWNVHYRWPYPTEADKVLLANATGLDQKQINNWFINQRKRHWKPSENMQFSVVDSLYGPFLHD